MLVHIYQCISYTCRAIARLGGVKKTSVTCPHCGGKMMYVKTEKE